MLDLYCYHSPVNSAVGFTMAAWRIVGDSCASRAVRVEDSAALQALLSGGAQALCYEDGAGRIAFVLRDIHVYGKVHGGWHMNFAIEADAESYRPWADLTAAILQDYNGVIRRFAGLFSVSYAGGEHYELDQQGFLRLLEDSTGKAQEFAAACGQPGDSKRPLLPFAKKLAGDFTPGKVKLPFIALSATWDYFREHTALKGCPKPGLCVDVYQWDDLLVHREPVERKRLVPALAGQESILIPLAAVGLIAASTMLTIQMVRLLVKECRKQKKRQGGKA